MNRLLSALMALVLVFAAAVPTLAVEQRGGSDDVRETQFFTAHEHTALNYADIEYERVDPEPLLREFEALRALFADAANAQEFYARFLKAVDEYDKMSAMLTILSIRKNADVTDAWAVSEYGSLLNDMLTVNDALCSLIRDALGSPCGDVLRAQLPDDVRDDYLAYEDMTEEQRALSAQEQALEDEYYAKMDDESLWTYVYGDREWTRGEVLNAYASGELDIGTAAEIYNGTFYKSQRAVDAIGGVYLRMIDVRNRLARSRGFDNYAEYAYAMVYDRDYTTRDVEAFSAAVKQYLVPEIRAYEQYIAAVDTSRLPEGVVYTGEGVFDTLRPYFARLSSELLEAMLYTVKHGAYSISDDPHKADASYSTTLSYYEMPFYFRKPAGSYQDLLTTIHEMGHNNVAYWKSEKWNEPNVDIDTAEVHSQGLELLMTHYYPELFGSQAGVAAVERANKVLDSIPSGCLYDELQRYAYATPGVTAEQISEKHMQLACEYGLVDPEDEEMASLYKYYWIRIHHTFDQPMYYISYATSAAGAFAFWEESQNDFFKAVDHYLAFCATTNSRSFGETFEAVGMESPVDAAYVRRLAQTLRETLFAYVAPFTDVRADAWYAPNVFFCYNNHLISGTTNTTFTPEGVTTRGQAMTILARLTAEILSSGETYTIEQGAAWAARNGICDGSDPGGKLTREQLALMFCNLARFYGVDVGERGDLNAFPDSGEISADARAAMSWAVGAGLINGMDGRLNPLGTTTRAQFAAIMDRFVNWLIK